MASWSILQLFVILNAHLIYLWLFGTFFAVLVCCIKKNLATLTPTISNLGHEEGVMSH
jgi:hypothetical protein